MICSILSILIYTVKGKGIALNILCMVACFCEYLSLCRAINIVFKPFSFVDGYGQFNCLQLVLTCAMAARLQAGILMVGDS